MRAAALLLTLAAVGGCGLNDCSFEVASSDTVGGLLVADGRAIGDTLTVAVVTETDPYLVLLSGAGLRSSPSVTPDGAVEVLYDARAEVGSGGRFPQPPLTAVRGDTVFVFLAGTFAEGVLTQACSPPLDVVELTVRDVIVPPGTVAARVVSIPERDLPPPTAAALRARVAARPAFITA